MERCLCGREIKPDPVGWEYGCNPYPLAKEGKCCYECDRDRVPPARFELYRKRKAASAKVNKEKGGK